MVGCVFHGLDGNAVPLNQLLTGTFQDEDAIQIYDKDSGYSSYSYWKDYGGWIDDNTFAVATTPIAPGTAFWLKTAKSTEVTLKGSVSTTEYVYESKAGFQMIALSFPAELRLNDTTKTTWENLTDGDIIQVRKDGAYTSYSYWKDYGGWIDDNTFAAVTTPIEVGASIWLKTDKDGVKLTVKP